MDLQSFRQKRQQYREQIFPHKIVRLDELRQVDDTLFEIDGQDITLGRGAIRTLTREIGSSARQIDTVRGASGTGGVANFRNYLSAAQGMMCERHAVLLADPGKKEVVDIIIPKKDFMPIDQFFDFAEFFMDATDTYPEKVEASLEGKMDVMVYLQSNHPETTSFAPGEDFISNGLFLKWTGDTVSLGNYFVRLVCSNGNTRQENRQLTTSYTLSTNDVNRLVQQACSQQMQEHNVELFKQRALSAQDSFASLRELRAPWSWLNKNLTLADEVVSEIVPYTEYEQHFATRGINTKQLEAQIKTDITIWQLFNNLTQFATHTTLLAPDDVKRNDIGNMAFNLLTTKHDITNYIEYAR